MTRRQQFIARRNRYIQKRFKFEAKKYVWVKVAGKTKRQGRAPDVPDSPGKQCEQRVSSNAYNAVLLTWPFLPVAQVFTGGGIFKPPHVRITHVPYVQAVQQGKHARGSLSGFHRRRVAYFPGHLKTVRRTKRERQITGCNWFYFRNGCFSDNDVLGRHPNETDIANGAPFPSDLWPVPLGY